MKILTFTILLFLMSCMNNPLTKDQSEKIYVHKVEMKKEVIKQKIVSFLAEYFVSAKAVIQSNEEQLITGNGNLFLKQDFLHMFRHDMDMTFLIKIENNQYKLKTVLKSVIMTENSSGGKSYLSATRYGDFKEEIESNFTTFDLALNEYITNNDSAF